MDVLNPALYEALRSRFGDVRVSDHGTAFRYEIVKDPVTGRPKIKQIHGGEQYTICCPVCGDAKFRLGIGHTWLTKPDPRCPMMTRNAKCYRRGCEVTDMSFYKDILVDIEDIKLFRSIKKLDQAPKPVIKPTPVHLPKGLVPLSSLPADHPALQFLTKQYNEFDPGYLSRYYEVGFTAETDDYYKLSRDRIIYPIRENGQLIGWQGRTIHPGMEPRWYLSTGFRKVFYNGDRITPKHLPVIAEGIPAAIACGPFHGTCLFGKEMDQNRAKLFGERWSGAIIATDPETFVPDTRPGADGAVYAQQLFERLSKHLNGPVYMLPWPKEILDQAKRKIAYETDKQLAKKQGLPLPPEQKITVPDPADLGFKAMAELIDRVPRRTIL